MTATSAEETHYTHLYNKDIHTQGLAELWMVHSEDGCNEVQHSILQTGVVYSERGPLQSPHPLQ